MKRIISVLVLILALGTASQARNLQEQKSFRKAVAVWAEGREKEVNLFLDFQSEFKLRRVGKAIIRLAASTDYRLRVNGEFVAHGPCVAAHDYYRIDAYDIAPYLKKGENVIAIEVAGYNCVGYYLLDQPSFLQAEVIVNGICRAFTGGESIKAYEQKQRSSESGRFSFQRQTAEAYSLGPGFDKWTEGAKPEGEVKLARQEDKKLLSRHVAYPDYRVHDAQKVSDSVYAFKGNSSGFLGLELSVSEPCRATANFDELIDEQGHVNPLRLGCEAHVDYDLQPGEYKLESFEPYTMQYVEMIVPDAVKVNRVYMRDYCNSDVNRAQFHSDNPKLDRLFETARETHRQSALDVFMDTPSRERAGWLCDSFFSARVAFDLTGQTLIEDNFLRNFLLPEKFEDIDEGMLPMCYPSDHWNHNYIPNWAMWFVLEMQEYYKRNLDAKMLADAKDRIYALVDYFKPFLNSDGLLENLKNWVFVEWSDANNYVQDVNYPSNMLYAGMLDAVAQMYSDEELALQAEQIRRTIREQAYDGRFFIDNAVRENGKLHVTQNHTEVCQYYALYFNISTSELYPDLWKRMQTEFGPIRKTVNNYPDVCPANAFVGNYLRLELLSRQGLSSQIMSEVIDEYTKMAELTGTFWENMSTSASCNHGFAAHIEHVLYRDILGLYDIDRATKTITLRFIPSGVNHCEGIVPLGKDNIRLEWDFQDGCFNYSIDLPEGYKLSFAETSFKASRR